MRPLLAAALSGFAIAVSAAARQAEPTIVYVVRHAERAEDGTDDPPISPAGEERARTLGAMMRDARLTHVHTTDFRRTRATAAPVSAQTGLVPGTYDDDIGALAARVRAQPGRHLVVGHSNTIPVIVRVLGGDPGNPTIAQDEYDRLYIVTLTGSGASTVLLRFGAPYRP